MANYTFTGKTIVDGDHDYMHRAFIDAGDADAEFAFDIDNDTVYVSTTLSEVDAETAVDDALAHTPSEYPSHCYTSDYTLVAEDSGKVVAFAGISKGLKATLPILKGNNSFFAIIVNEDPTYDVDIQGLSGATPKVGPASMKMIAWTGGNWLIQDTGVYAPA